MNRFFCFHTGKRYGLLARKCARSFAHFGVHVNLIEFQCDQGWMKACLARAIKLNELAKKYPDDGVGLLDSDLTCIAHPKKLVEFSSDLLIHDLTDTQPGKTASCFRFSAGVSVFGPTIRGRECLQRWADLCSLDPTPNEYIREQQYLFQAIRSGTHDKYGQEIKKNPLIVTNIGEKYNMTLDRYGSTGDTAAVILHHVASRKLKEQVSEKNNK